MAQNNSITRSVYFFRVKFQNNQNQDIDPVKVLTHINSQNYTTHGRYLEYDSGKFLSMNIDSLNFPLNVQFGIKRENDLPYLENSGNISPLKIPNNTGLFEPTHFSIFKYPIKDSNYNIMGIEYNFFGPKTGQLKNYFLQKTHGMISKMEFYPLMRQDINQLLSDLSNIRMFSIGIHRDYTEHTSDLDASLPGAFTAVKNLSDAEYLDISIKKNHYPGEITISFWDKLANFISHNANYVSNLKVRAKKISTDRVETLDLLKNILISKRSVLKDNLNYKAVNKDEMFREIEAAYTDYLPLFEKILGRRL